MQLAQVTVVEVADTPEPVDGGPAPCEGLRPEGHTTQVYAAADTPADVGWNPLAADDQFEREVPAGGFGSTDIPGDPWAVVSGPPEDLSVTGGVGVIQLAEPLNANPYFETDVAGWEPTGGTFVRSTEHAHEGVASGLLTPSGEDGFVFVECEPGPETVPGTTWRFAAWVRCDVSRDVVLSLYWFDDDGDLLDLDESDPVTVPANTWVQLSFSWTAPEDTAQVAGDVYMPDEAPPSHRLFIDEAGITPEPVDRKVVTGPAVRDVEVHARVRITRPPGGEPINAYLHGRHVDEQNGYTARLAFVPDGTVGVGLEMLHDGEPIVLAELETARDWQGRRCRSASATGTGSACRSGVRWCGRRYGRTSRAATGRAGRCRSSTGRCLRRAWPVSGRGCRRGTATSTGGWRSTASRCGSRCPTSTCGSRSARPAICGRCESSTLPTRTRSSSGRVGTCAGRT
ncbi:carbohydrate binding domain-containing protein [Micromonospora endophytica]|uniref:carbohydrate binding domain-containing protein n=1 Tax=Micromonospora endophytica TaxID=515350 RepID=UPI002018216D|nr:carbohydrate binding domain-containing protein [Micromonospora endophytica]